MRTKLVVATQFHRRLRGGSFPALVQANDGLNYVIKAQNNPQGRNVPFNDYMATTIFRRCGLTVPPVRVVQVPRSIVGEWLEWQTNEPETYDLQTSSGACFGSAYLGGQGLRLYDILPDRSLRSTVNRHHFWLAWLLDALLENMDRRQIIFFGSCFKKLGHVFIDQGHCFSGPDGLGFPDFAHSYYFDSRVYPDMTQARFLSHRSAISELDLDRLWREALDLPPDWLTKSGLSRFSRCLDNLGRATIVEQVQTAIADIMCRRRRETKPATQTREEVELRQLLYIELPSGSRQAATSRYKG